MKNLRVSLMCAIIFIGVLGGGISAQAITRYEDSADVLNKLGLFAGSDLGYELERAPRRIEAGVMLIRLLGKEEEVLEGSYTHPFEDVPSWADKYVGYMYENGLTKGTSDKTFGSNDLTDANSYATFVLRSMGYDDSKGDFSWSTAVNSAVENGLLSDEEAVRLKSDQFLRDDMVNVSLNALSCEIKTGNMKLIEMLMDQGAVSAEAAEVAGLVETVVKVSVTKEEMLKSYVDFPVSSISTKIQNMNIDGWNSIQYELDLKQILPYEVYSLVGYYFNMYYDGHCEAILDTNNVITRRYYGPTAISSSKYQAYIGVSLNLGLKWSTTPDQYGYFNNHNVILLKDVDGNDLGFVYASQWMASEDGTTIDYAFVPYIQDEFDALGMVYVNRVEEYVKAVTESLNYGTSNDISIFDEETGNRIFDLPYSTEGCFIISLYGEDIANSVEQFIAFNSSDDQLDPFLGEGNKIRNGIVPQYFYADYELIYDAQQGKVMGYFHGITYK